MGQESMGTFVEYVDRGKAYLRGIVLRLQYTREAAVCIV